jgi:hypothetical protein
MEENDKGFSFRRLFIRDTEAVPENKTGQQQVTYNQQPVTYNQQPPTFSKSGQNDFPATSSLQQPVQGISEPSMVEDFVQRLQNLINQNNQPGFDFLEFTESLFEERQNPGPEVYKTVFRIAQKMDKSLTPSRLLQSAMFYKDLVQRTAESEAAKGETKKQGLQADKDNERNTLDNSLRDIRSKIQQLNQQIQELQNQDVMVSNQLMAIDQKYGNQLIEIDRKISAIRNAKEQVITSIVDIEAGIKSNLS